MAFCTVAAALLEGSIYLVLVYGQMLQSIRDTDALFVSIKL